jgi:hypothetical protein
MLGKHGHMTDYPCLGWENTNRGIKMGDTDKKRNDNSEAAALQLNQWDGRRLGTSDSVQISKSTHRPPKSSSLSQHQMAILWVYPEKINFSNRPICGFLKWRIHEDTHKSSIFIGFSSINMYKLV